MWDNLMLELVRRIEALERRAARLEEQESGPQTVFLTTQLTSTSWNGDSKTNANNGVIDLSAVFGVPAGVKAVLVAMTCKSATGGIGLILKPDSDASNAPPINLHTLANTFHGQSAWVPCNADGDVYFSSSSATGANVWIEIWGYAI